MSNYTIHTPYATYENVEITFSPYNSNKRLALQAWNDEGPIATISVNLPDEKVNDPEHEFFVDTNNCPWAPMFLRENGIAWPAGGFGFSGFCGYPLFTTDRSKAMIEE